MLSSTLMNNDEAVSDLSNLQDNEFSNLRLIFILNKTETNLANKAYSTFLAEEQRALI